MSIGQLWRFLVRSGTCTGVLAICGLLFLCCGGNGFVKNQTPPEVKSVAMAELEATTRLPNDSLLKLPDGYLFWDAAVESITTTTTKSPYINSQRTSRDINAVYVPLLSKVTFDNWAAFLAKDGAVAFLPHEKCCVVVKFDFVDLRRKYPEVAAALQDKVPLKNPPESRITVQGVVHRLGAEPNFIVEAMCKNNFGYATDTLVLVYGSDPSPHTETNRILSLCIVAFGLLLVLPFGVWTFRRRPNRPTDKKDSALRSNV